MTDDGSHEPPTDRGKRREQWWWWRLLHASADDEESLDGSQVPITVSPDPRIWRARRNALREGSWIRKRWDEVFVPADPPESFAAESLADLATQLRTSDEGVARGVLAEAEAAYNAPQQTIDSAERRATTLQGTVAIAASVAFAGGGLLLEPSRVQGHGWRGAMVVLLGLFVVCLLACAMRALGATARIFNFEEPGFGRITERAAMSNAEALTNRAAELLRASAVADMVASVKVGLLRSAAWWFRRALVFLALLTILIGVYAVAGAPRATTDSSSTPHSRLWRHQRFPLADPLRRGPYGTHGMGRPPSMPPSLGP